MSDKLENALLKRTAPKLTKEQELISELQWSRDPHRMTPNPFKPGSDKFTDERIKELQRMKQRELERPTPKRK